MPASRYCSPPNCNAGDRRAVIVQQQVGSPTVMGRGLLLDLHAGRFNLDFDVGAVGRQKIGAPSERSGAYAAAVNIEIATGCQISGPCERAASQISVVIVVIRLHLTRGRRRLILGLNGNRECPFARLTGAIGRLGDEAEVAVVWKRTVDTPAARIQTEPAREALHAPCNGCRAAGC